MCSPHLVYPWETNTEELGPGEVATAKTWDRIMA